MLSIGKHVLIHKGELAFYNEFAAFWKTMPDDKKAAAKDGGVIHCAYNPGCKPKGPVPETATMNTDGELVL